MKYFNLSATVRQADQLGRRVTKALRREELVPVVLYGGSKAKHPAVKTDDLSKLIYTPEIYFVELDVEGKQHKVVLKDVQFHPVGDKTPHTDLCEVSKEKPIIIRVPVILGGHAVGVRAGGKLARERRTLRARAIHDKTPENPVVDVNSLKPGKTIQIHELSFKGLELVDAPRTVVRDVKLAHTAHGKSVADAAGDESGKHGDSGEQSSG